MKVLNWLERNIEKCLLPPLPSYLVALFLQVVFRFVIDMPLVDRGTFGTSASLALLFWAKKLACTGAEAP